MACSITITGVTGITTNNFSPDSITVSGTVTDCPTIDVRVHCGPSPAGFFVQTSVPGNTASGNWTAVFSSADLVGFNCACGETVLVQAICSDSCTASMLYHIDCCPTVVFDPVQEGACKDDGTKPVTVGATVTPGPNSGAAVQADLVLDGTVVATGTAASPSSPLSLSYYHPGLLSGTHNLVVNVTEPDCGTTPMSFSFDCTASAEYSADCKRTYKRWLCPLLYTMMMVSFITAFTLLFLQTCGSIPGAAAVITVAFLVGFVALAFFQWLCTSCVCGWLPKLFWRIFFAVGTILVMFANFCTTNTLLYIGLVMLLIGIALLFHWAKICNKSTCDVVKEALYVMGVGLLPVVGLIFGLGASTSWLYVLFMIGSSPFTVITLLIFVYFGLALYEQTNC